MLRQFDRHQGLMLRCSALAMGACLLMGSALDAEARTYRHGRPQARAALEAQRKPLQKPQPKAQDALLAVVSIAKQRITIYGPQGVLGHSPISSGAPGHATPTGVFTVLQKNKFHRSNIYSGAPMPFMQRLTWSGIALHAGALPGYPASHGCIRLPMNFAQDLWAMTRLGARVVVMPDEAQPKAVAHAKLPTPTLFPPDVAEAPQAVKTAAAESNERTDAAPPAPKPHNPIEWARLRKAPLAARAAAKAQEAKELSLMAVEKAREANAAIKAVVLAERAIGEAKAKRASTADYVAKIERQRPALAEKAREALKAVEEREAQALAALPELKAKEEAAVAAAFEASAQAWGAEFEGERAAIAAKSAEKTASGEPISILVSRKTGRIQIRQGWETLYDAPATFTGGAEPLGTHVYVALEPGEDGQSLRWTSVSFNGGAPAPEVRARGRKPAAAAAPVASKETAESVLEKFELSEASRAFIAERLWTGATLIISDQGPSHETGKTTDFVILTR
ncbi:MAG: L,D-transpeptidase [Hyphomicrobiales bacterium]|nr:MAG: L,D-transpeptidase [Hyphomicrobiales bacterium]